MKDKLILFIGILIMAFLILIEIPFSNNEIQSSLIQGSLLRFIGAIMFIYLIFSSGNKHFLQTSKPNKKAFLISIPALLIVMNNFPISAYLKGNASITEPVFTIVLFFLFTITISLFEEIIFRGVVLNLFIEQKDQTKKNIFLAMIYSSGIFAFIHLLNLLGGAGFLPTILQVGYTFLTGMMFAYLYLVTKNILIPIIIHAIYNIGGLSFHYIGTISNQWDTVTVVVTIILSLAVITIYTYAFFRTNIIFELDET